MIREARPEESEAIAVVHVRSWQAAYRDLFSGKALSRLSVATRAEMWRAKIASEASTVIVAEEDAIVHGFVAVGPSEESASLGELYAIYVEPSRWRSGIGRGLCREAEEALRGEGLPEAILWVWEGNARARRFYEAQGWRTDGTRVV